MSGAFFWFKNKSIFSRNWKQFFPNMYGLEGYLGTHCSSAEAYSLPPELPEGFEQIYLKKNWEHFYKI
jgi:hypothetical protein